MGLIHLYFVAAGFISHAAPVVVVQSSVSVSFGHKVTLPCWLNPPDNAEKLEVRWYRTFESPVLLYQKGKFETSTQEPSYVGRASFGLKDEKSGGLKTGDVSLELVNVTTADTGEYTCYVTSDSSYDNAKVHLSVTKKGTQPLLTAEWKEDNKVNISCVSEDWFPSPTLRWSHQKQDVNPGGLRTVSSPSGLVSVHSWLLVPSLSEVSCSVGLHGEEAREAKVQLKNVPQPVPATSPAAGWVAFALLLVSVLVALGVWYFRKRVPEKKADSDCEKAEENEPLLVQDKRTFQSTDLETAKKSYVNVTLNKEPNNRYVTIANSILRDAKCAFPDGEKVTCVTAVRGSPGFSSGRHYWEVSMGTGKVGFKQSWWIGVTSVDVIPQDPNVSPTAGNGYLFLSSSPDKPLRFQLSTGPEVFLPVDSTLRTVGVYLDYDGGELSFYNVEEKRLIGSFAAAFKGEVFPLFNPGKYDKAPMEILQRPEQLQENNVGSPAPAEGS